MGKVSYDRRLLLATFSGPGGFTQVQMPEYQAAAIAEVLDIPFVVSEERP